MLLGDADGGRGGLGGGAGGPGRGDEDEGALGLEESLRLIEGQRAVTARRLWGGTALFCVPWGVAWLVGFGAFFLHYGLSERPYGLISAEAATAVLFAALLLALVATCYMVAKQGALTRGVSRQRGTMYGLSWFLAFAPMWLIAGHFAPLLHDAEASLLWASLSVWIVSVLSMAGAAVWRHPPMFYLGVWIGVVNSAGVLAGPGWHSLLSSIAGGGGLILFGLLPRLGAGKA
ncbi:hypothetical protein [Sphaerisporangium fuscum]|uniref:hypothetical protein n=1 Tax=Sphaerisporangium fuscum TaxID=2835868 RepID=UPI001BDD1592|nr:hypothetical protein [Sphaerisporangium fuscum]